MSGNSTGKARENTHLEKLDSLTVAEIEAAAQSDPDTLFLEDCDMSTLQLVMPEKKKAISLRIDPDILAYFRSLGKGYQTRMNAVLRSYVKAQLEKQGTG